MFLFCGESFTKSEKKRGPRSTTKKAYFNCEGHALVTIDDVRTTVARSRDGERPDADRCHRHPRPRRPRPVSVRPPSTTVRACFFSTAKKRARTGTGNRAAIFDFSFGEKIRWSEE